MQKKSLVHSLVSVSLVAVLAFCVLVPAAAPHSLDADSRVLEPLRVIEKTGGRISRDGLTSTVVVKFREGSDIRRNGGIDLAPTAERSGARTAIASAAPLDRVQPTFDRPVAELRAEESKLETRTGRDLADLSLYLDIQTSSPDEALHLARDLESFEDVEFAYVRAEPLRPPSAPVEQRGVDTGHPPDLTPLQFYLDTAPGGFGVRAAWAMPGNRGANVRIVDIEYSWNLNHEDLPFAETPPFLYVEGFDPFPNERGNHGTAVLGMLVGVENDYGVTGICPEAQVGLINPVRSNTDYRLAASIDQASDVLTRDGGQGDIIQIEQQARGINDEFAALPPEWDPAVFDAIQRAVAKGVTVVEPAGNGGFVTTSGGGLKARGANLDDSRLGGAFNRKKKDSGAVVVGGAFPVDSMHTPTSNYGSRVDVQGHGVGVCTLGYGNLWDAGSLTTLYTNNFGGTSSAAACVTGVATLIQSALRAEGIATLRPDVLRQVLAGTGSPDGSGKSEAVGPRPDAATAIPLVTNPDAPFITGLTYKKKKERLLVDGLYLKGLGFPVDERSVVLINGQPAETEYSTGYDFNGTTTRLTVLHGVADLAPKNQISYISIQTGDLISPRRVFVRK